MVTAKPVIRDSSKVTRRTAAPSLRTLAQFAVCTWQSVMVSWASTEPDRSAPRNRQPANSTASASRSERSSPWNATPSKTASGSRPNAAGTSEAGTAGLRGVL